METDSTMFGTGSRKNKLSPAREAGFSKSWKKRLLVCCTEVLQITGPKIEGQTYQVLRLLSPIKYWARGNVE